MTKLTPAVLRTLKALWEQTEMRAYTIEFYRMSGVKRRAQYLLMARLEDLNYIVRDHTYVHLTLKGRQALHAHYEALYNDRPCNAYQLDMEKYARFPDREA